MLLIFTMERFYEVGLPHLVGRFTVGDKEGWDAKGPPRLWLAFGRVGGTAVGERVWVGCSSLRDVQWLDDHRYPRLHSAGHPLPVT